MQKLTPNPTREPALDAAMERYVDGDPKAFDELYAALAPRVYGYLLQLARDRSLADDLLQVTFMRIHGARGGWIRGAAVTPWALAIARNAAFDAWRARKRARVQITASGDLPELPPAPEDPGPNPAVVEALNTAIAKLPTPYREALVLTKERDLTLKQAAAVAGTTEMAMKLRVHRAYRKLRGLLRPSDGDPPPASSPAPLFRETPDGLAGLDSVRSPRRAKKGIPK